MRAATEVEPLALPIDGQRLIAGDGLDDLDLVVLAHFSEGLDGLFASPFFTTYRDVAPGNLGHLLFDAAEVVVGEGSVGGEVIEEAVLDHRPDGDLGPGKQILNGVSHQVSGGVADGVDARFALRRDDLDLRAVENGRVHINDFPVDLAGECCLRQPPADGCSHVGDGGALRHLFHASVRELYLHAVLEKLV